MNEMEQYNVLLLGKSGDGKSHTGNTILGRQCFQVHHGSTSCISSCNAESTTIRGRNFKVIDPHGIYGTRIPDEDVKTELVRCITECSPGINAFVIVLRAERYTEQEMEIVKRITDMFGEEALKYAVVLFTRGDQLEDDQTIEQFVEENENLSELVQKCGGRCHVIDNKYWNQEHEYRSNRVQVDRLINTIEEMVRQNGGGSYTNKILQAVEREIQTEQRPGETRKDAMMRVVKKLLAKLAGVTVGALLGALLGLAAVAAVVIAIHSYGMGGIARKVLAARGLPAVKTVLYGAAAAAAAGAIGGGVVGVQAVEDGDGVKDAAKKAATANWENAKYYIEETKELVGKVFTIFNT